MTLTMVDNRVESSEGERLHPRPQLTRAHWIDLSGPWAFAYDDEARGLRDGWHERADVYDRTITVPFPPESPASGIGDTGFHPIVWYRRSYPLTPPDTGQPEAGQPDAGQRWLLHCGAVDYRAQVWVNGRLVATHEGGHTPFQADITDALRPDGEQVIVIRAEDAPADLAQPRGKQGWKEQPHDIWYHRTTGIWQPVWLEPLPATHVASLRWTPDVDNRALGLDVTMNGGDARPLQLHVRLTLDGAVLADELYPLTTAEAHWDVPLDAMTTPDELLLWSPEHPNLIEATLTLREGAVVVDQVHSYAGLRSAGIGDGSFLLNRRPYYLRLALEQGYWPQSHLAAPSAAALRREVELALELGFNGVRIHQKVEDPRFLYWCDKLGLLVWGEMANAYRFSPAAITRLTREWVEVVARDYSHPCIVAWVPLNESWGANGLSREAAPQHLIQALYHLTKALDPTRPAIDNDGWEHLVSDVYGVHDYSWDGAKLRARYGSAAAVERTLREEQLSHRALLLEGHRRTDEPVMVTEFGGISYAPQPGTDWFGYGTVAGADQFLAKYRELMEAILACPTIVGFCYTQLADTGQETNGLLTPDRTPKIDPAIVRAITTGVIAPADDSAA